MWILPKNYQLSFHYVADMVESSEDLSCLDTIIGSSLFVRSKPMSKSSLSRKWKRDKWFRHLCGQILKPSQHRSFETRLISYLQAIPANRLAKPVDGEGKMIHATCGPTSKNTSEQYDLFNASSKTSKDILRWDSPQLSQIWKNWVIEQRGEYSQRKKSAHLIREKECLSWPTPRHSEYKGCGPIGSKSYQHFLEKKYLTAQVMNFQPDQDKTSMNGKNQELSNWPTPRHQDGKHAEPTDWEMNTSHVGTANSLRVKAAKNWPTPTKNDMKDTWNGERGETLVSKMKEKRSGKLNPDWCEQLMGLPVGWTKIDDADDRISRLMAIGNGVVPQTAALAWEILNKKLTTTKTED